MLSQTVEYALRAMVHLAALGPDQSVNSESIARSARIPHGYLSKILRAMVLAKLVSSQRGPNGGFRLARSAENVSLLDVINAVDPIARITKCPLGNSAHVALCPLHHRLDGAIAMIEREFKKTTLAELLRSSSSGSAVCQLLQRETKRH